MIEFYTHYIHPTSTHRAKIAVHLIAQGLAPPTVATAVIEKGIQILGLNKTGKDEEDGEAVEVKPEGNGTTPIVITDVREFKSRLQVSAGPQPVKHLSEFEELDSKL
jgi:insulysin